MRIDYTNVVANDDLAPYAFLRPLDGWHVEVTTTHGLIREGFLHVGEDGQPFHISNDYPAGALNWRAASFMPDQIKEIVIS